MPTHKRYRIKDISKLAQINPGTAKYIVSMQRRGKAMTSACEFRFARVMSDLGLAWTHFAKKKEAAADKTSVSFSKSTQATETNALGYDTADKLTDQTVRQFELLTDSAIEKIQKLREPKKFSLTTALAAAEFDCCDGTPNELEGLLLALRHHLPKGAKLWIEL